jgi:hypothetical protein
MSKEDAQENRFLMDTHLHSTKSDGLWTPTEVVRKAKAHGLEVIALTDHDTLDGLEEAIEEGKLLGIKVISGVEIDIEYAANGYYVTNIEMLGLNFDIKKIEPFIIHRKVQRRQTVELSIEAYNQYIHDSYFREKNKTHPFPLRNTPCLTYDSLQKWKQESLIKPGQHCSKNDLLMYLAQVCAEPNQTIQRLLKFHKPSGDDFRKSYEFIFNSFSVKPSFYEAIHAVKAAGGKAVFAHPGISRAYIGDLRKGWEDPQSLWYHYCGHLTPVMMIHDLRSQGLDGLEIYNYVRKDLPHAKQAERINTYFAEIADRFGMLKTYGSDCHGPKGNGPQIGRFGATKIIDLDK